MRVIVAGSRGVQSLEVVAAAIFEAGFIVTEVVSGTAGGVDRLGERWAGERRIPVARFPAEWSRLGRGAGVLRNERMASYAEALVAVWDGQSRGTADMIRRARAHGLRVHVHRAVASQEKR